MSTVFELVAAPVRQLLRAATWWAVGIPALVAATVAFWPAFRGSSGISQAIDQLPAGVVQAFGLQEFGTPAGFLRGNLYELFVPLLLAVAAVALANGQTANEETAGRLELYLAQPVSHRSIYLGRAAAVLVALLAVTVVLGGVQFAADAVADLEIPADHLLATIVLCLLLGALHGCLAIAVAGITPRPGLVMGVGLAVAIGGYAVAALFPLSSALEPWRVISPWSWAFGGDPLSNPTAAWRFLALLGPAVILLALGTWAFGRRDLATA